jgi:hypothetical protein
VVPDGDGIGAALGGDQGAVAEEVVAVAGAGTGDVMGGDQGTGDVDVVAGAGTGDVMGGDQGTGAVDVVAGAGAGAALGGDQGAVAEEVVAGAGVGAALGGDQGAVTEEVVAGAGAGAALGGDQGAVAGAGTGDAIGGDQGSGAKDVLPTGAALGGDQGEFAGAGGVAGLDPTPVAPQDAARSAADMGADAEVAGVAVTGGVGTGAAAGVDPTPVAPHDAARSAADMAGEAVVVVAGAETGGAETGAGSGVEPTPVAPQDFAKSSADLGADAEAVAGAGVALGGDQGAGADAALGEGVAGRGDCPVDCRALSFSMGPHRDFPASAASDTCSVRCSYTDLVLSVDGKGIGLESGAGVATGPVKSFMAAHCLGTAGADTADAAPFEETGTLLLPIQSLTAAQPVGKSVAWLASNGVVLAGAGIGLVAGDPVACAQVASTVSAMPMALVTSNMPQRAELPLPLASSVRRWLRN